MTYPLASLGKIIGTPFAGTHAKAFNVAGGSDNWESERAVDIAVPIGTPVRAVTDGVIGSQIGSLSLGGRFAGLRLHLLGGGNEYYYAHLSKLTVRAGQTVKAGDILGYSGSANGVAHLHFAQKTGDPQQTLTGKSSGGGGGFLGIPGALSSVGKAIIAPPGSKDDVFGKAGAKVGGAANDAVTSAAKAGATAALGGLWDAIGKDATRGLLYVVLVGGGLALALTGVTRALGVNAPRPHLPIPVPV